MENSQVTQRDEHFGYSDEIQAKIVAMLLFDEAKFNELKEIILPEHFDNPVHQDMVKIAYSFYKKYKQRITEDELLEELDSLLWADKKLPIEEYLRVAEKIINLGREGDYAFAYDKLVEFAKDRAYRNAAVNSVDMIRSKNYEKITKMFKQADEIGKRDNEDLDTVNLSDVKIKRISWFWENRIPRAKLSFIVGNPGVAKSYFTMMLAAHTTTGKPWPTRPPCPTPPERGRVIILTAEDGLEDTVAPRVESCGGERDKVWVIKGTKEGSDGSRTFNLLTDLRKLEQLIEKLKDVRLVIIDPVSAYLGVGKAVDTHKDKDVRGALAPVVALAEKYDVTIIGVVHLNKTKDLQAIYRVTGSMAFVAAARSVWLIERDRQDKTIKHFVPVKCNLSVGDPGGLSFIISSNRIEFLEGESEYDADTILAPEDKRTRKKGMVQKFLLNFIEGKTEVDAGEVISEAKKEGISDATLNRAKIDMGIKSEQVWDNKQKKWVWKLPSWK